MTARKKHAALALPSPTPEYDESGDPRDLFAFVARASASIESAIREAHFYRVLFLKVEFLRKTTKHLRACKFVMEYDDGPKLWTVGHVRINRRSKGRDIVVAREKLDDAINDAFTVWQMWAEQERKKGKGGRKK